MSDNELIAEFMGFVFINDDPKQFPNGYYFIVDDDEGTTWLKVSEMQYEESWDWLMPVIAKIDKICVDKQKEFPDDKNLDDPKGWRAWSYRNLTISTNIEGMYLEVVDFIKWYNAQPK